MSASSDVYRGETRPDPGAPVSDILLWWRLHPEEMVKDVFRVQPDAWQMDALRSIAVNQRTSMVACKGPGKTCVLAWAAWWFLLCFENCNIAATSCTEDNLKDGLWKEMAKWQGKSQLLSREFDWAASRICRTGTDEHGKPKGANWWMSARTWAKSADSSAQASALAGLHEDNIMFICDEAGSYPPGIVPTAEAALANDMPGPATCARLILAGNPEETTSPLYRAATVDRSMWTVINISSDPQDPKRTPRVSKEWAQQQIDAYGRDSNYVKINILGQFPTGGADNLISLQDAEACIDRATRKDWYSHLPRLIGVDAARFGDDRTVILRRQGCMTWEPVVLREADTDTIASRVVASIRAWDGTTPGQAVSQDGPPIHVIVDGTGGYGAGVVDMLRSQGFTVHEVHSSEKAPQPGYLNIRSWMYWLASEWIKAGTGCLPGSDDGRALCRELSTPTYKYRGGDILQVESKEEIKKRLGASPDIADAFCLTFAVDIQAAPPPATAEQLARHRILQAGRGGGASDWDPVTQGEW